MEQSIAIIKILNDDNVLIGVFELSHIKQNEFNNILNEAINNRKQIKEKEELEESTKNSSIEEQKKELEESILYTKRLAAKAYLETEIDNGSTKEPENYSDFNKMFQNYVIGEDWNDDLAPQVFKNIISRSSSL
jgi:hypothetical protein